MVERIKGTDNGDSADQAAAVQDPPEQKDPIQARREQFDAEQFASKKAFERNANADIARMEREQKVSEEKAERLQKINARKQELLERSFADGLITHDDMERQRNLLAPHSQQGSLAPHEALAPGENTVLMGFRKPVTLTLSAHNIKRMNGLDADAPTVTGSISHGSRVHFAQGYNDVPESLADHQYLYDAGGFRCDEDGKPETLEAREARLSKNTAPKQEAKEEPAQT